MILPQHFRIQAKQGAGQSGITEMQLGRLDETFHPIGVSGGQFFLQKDSRQQRHIFTISNEMEPFGGVKQSGNGREGSKYGMDD